MEVEFINNIKNYSLEELKNEFENLQEKPYRAEQVYDWIYQKRIENFDEMTNLSLDLREKLKTNFELNSFKIIKKLESVDGTKKYLFDVNDGKGNLIESVLMKYHYGYSVCVSSQIGCKMGCKFCASTGIKFERNLEVWEIIQQILEIEKEEEIRISNIVFMGIGEPLDNYENVIKSIRIINDYRALNIGARHISISTCGLVPKIYDLANENLQCTLSVSLHSANDAKRSEMMPINKRYSLEELMESCKFYISKTNKRISFEYALAKEENDNLSDAEELARMLKGMLAHVNLIPINKITDGKYTKSTNENIIKFRDYLNSRGIVATIRRELGTDIQAACGQLRKQSL